MADILISHSGKDGEVAAAIGERIRRERPTWSPFYDKDNIRAGNAGTARLRVGAVGSFDPVPGRRKLKARRDN